MAKLAPHQRDPPGERWAPRTPIPWDAAACGAALGGQQRCWLWWDAEEVGRAMVLPDISSCEIRPLGRQREVQTREDGITLVPVTLSFTLCLKTLLPSPRHRWC